MINRALGLLNKSRLGPAGAFRQLAVALVDFLAAYAESVRAGLGERMAWLGARQEEQRRASGAEEIAAIAALAPAPPAARAATPADGLLSPADAFGLRSVTPALDQAEFVLAGSAADVAAERDACGALLADGPDAFCALLEEYAL